MHAEAVHIGIDAHHGTIVLDNPLVHGIRMEMLCQSFSDVVLDRPKQRAVKILPMSGGIQILRDASLCFQTHWDVTRLVTFAMHAKMQYAFALVEITPPRH